MKKQKKIKMWVRLFKIMGEDILCGNYLGRNFPGGNLPGGSLTGGSFPDTTLNV